MVGQTQTGYVRRIFAVNPLSVLNQVIDRQIQVAAQLLYDLVRFAGLAQGGASYMQIGNMDDTEPVARLSGYGPDIGIVKAGMEQDCIVPGQDTPGPDRPFRFSGC